MSAKRLITLTQVVEAAVALSDSGGESALTLGGVAAALGVKPPSLYHHVDGLHGLQRAVTLWGVQQMADDIRRAAVGRSGADAVRACAEAYRRFALAHPAAYGMLQRAVEYDDEAMRAATEDFLEVVVAIVAPFSRTPEDALHHVRAMRSVLHGFVDLEARGGFRMALDLDESFRRLVDLLIAGLTG